MEGSSEYYSPFIFHQIPLLHAITCAIVLSLPLAPGCKDKVQELCILDNCFGAIDMLNS